MAKLKTREAPARELKLSTPQALPERYVHVELTTCNEAGEPFVVRCEQVLAKEASVIIGHLPGDVVRMGEREPDRPAELDAMPRLVEAYMQLIEAGTALSAPGGGFVRPAFWFNENRPRHELSIDGRRLPISDISIMGSAILNLSGYGGGAATGVFPGKNGE